MMILKGQLSITQQCLSPVLFIYQIATISKSILSIDIFISYPMTKGEMSWSRE